MTLHQTRLLIADVDGTLLTRDKTLTVRARDAVHRLLSAGINFTITSSRPPRGLAMLIDPLKITCPIAAFNGGILVEPDLKTVLEQKPLAAPVASNIVDYLLKSGLEVWVFRGTDWFVRDSETPLVVHEMRAVRFSPTAVENLHTVLDGAVKIMGVSNDTELVARCEAELQKRVQGLASASRSQSYYLDITHPDATKGMAARALSRSLQIPLDEIAVIGDMPNDVPMFGIAGKSIAMGNASLEVQRSAQYVTTSNENEGFAHAIDRFILGETHGKGLALGLPENVRACLFDLDGVLTQTSKLHAVAWKQLFDEYLQERAKRESKPFVAFDAVQDYSKYVDGKLRIDGAKSFLASRGIHLTEEEVHDLASRKDERFLDILKHQRVETYEGSVRYVHAVREAGLRTAVVSSSKHTREVLASAGISDLFEVLVDGNVASEQHLAGKPAPDTFLACARALNTDPKEAVVFEDAISGVEAGHAGHFGYVVGVDRLGQAEGLRRHGADRVVQDLATLLEKKA